MGTFQMSDLNGIRLRETQFIKKPPSKREAATLSKCQLPPWLRKPPEKGGLTKFPNTF